MEAVVGSTTRSIFSPRKGHYSLPLLPEYGDRVELLHRDSIYG